MVAVADQFVSVFIGMYLEKIHYWCSLDPTCTGEFVVCLPWDSVLTEVDTQIIGDSCPAHDRRKGVEAIMGQWPGDETDEEIERALREMS